MINKICIIGWHYLEDFYQKIKPIKDDVFIVAHRENDLLKDFNHKVIDNVGLDFGAYDWYIKNVWDGKSNVLFLHDDIYIKNLNTISNILKECEHFEQTTIWNNKDEAEANGWQHGRCFYGSGLLIKWLLKKHEGFWYDKNNNGYTDKNTQSTNPKCLHYNAAIRNFKKTVQNINEKEGMARSHIYNKDIILYKRGHNYIIKKRYDIINFLIRENNYKKYLEIGVRNNKCFNKILCEEKDGLDINEKYNCRYNMSSDIFFKTIPNDKIYDIIFIDGLHLEEQVTKDIYNSLKHLSENGTIVVHDCNPGRLASQLREKTVKKWNGDVWKSICKLRCKHDDLKISVVNIDNGCGIITKGKQYKINIPKDTELTYDFLNDNRKYILNLISVEKFIMNTTLRKKK